MPITIRTDSQQRKIAAAVVGDRHPFARLISGHITGVVTAAGLFVEELQRTGLFVELKKQLHCLCRRHLQTRNTRTYYSLKPPGSLDCWPGPYST